MSEFIIIVLQILLNILFVIGVIGFILGVFFPGFYNKHIDIDNKQ